MWLRDRFRRRALPFRTGAFSERTRPASVLVSPASLFRFLASPAMLASDFVGGFSAIVLRAMAEPRYSRPREAICVARHAALGGMLSTAEFRACSQIGRRARSTNSLTERQVSQMNRMLRRGDIHALGRTIA